MARTAVWFLVWALLIAPAALGRTWRVEKDGSGDYTTIQPAVDGAAVGDTIRLGAGRWTECHLVHFGGSSFQNVYVHVTVDSLTFIGAGREQTIIGPPAPIHLPTEFPKGIAVTHTYGFTALTVRQLTVENTRDGVYEYTGSLLLQDVEIRGCYNALASWAELGTIVESCVFKNSFRGAGILAFAPAGSFLIRDCVFEGNAYGVDFYTVEVLIEDCVFRQGGIGAQFVDATIATVRDCVFEQSLSIISLALLNQSRVALFNNAVRGGMVNLLLDWRASVSGSGNVFVGGDQATIRVPGSQVGTSALHGNHILHGRGPSVVMEYFPYQTATLDLTNNYWGTTSADSIAAWIQDGHDDPSVHAFVEFEPFSSVPLSEERRSFGGVKDLFRRGRSGR